MTPFRQLRQIVRFAPNVSQATPVPADTTTGWTNE